MKDRVRRWAVLLAGSVVMGCLLTGCAWSVGSSKDGHAELRPTRGQELLDLKKARDNGAMTEEEYQKQKERILGK